jgi:PilZ domain-containing protein
MSDAEKRRHHRHLALLEVRVLPGDGLPDDLKLATIDIGTGGALCASNRPIDADALLRLRLTLIGGDLRSPATVDVEATVLRCTRKAGAIESRRFELALQFTKVEAEDKKRLQAYLNNL